MIDKDTKIYCSFSSNPGNNGCIFFNNAFYEKNINAIYKSFYSNDIKKSIDAVKQLNISGFSVSMPFKVVSLNYVNEISEEVKTIGSCNTILNNDGHLIAHNTDYIGVKEYIKYIPQKLIYILGDGGFSKSVQYACNLLNIQFKIICRSNWNEINQLKDQLLFNATPIEIQTNKNLVIDARPFTKEGKKIFANQAIHQFKLYTGIDYGEYNVFE